MRFYTVETVDKIRTTMAPRPQKGERAGTPLTALNRYLCPIYLIL
ncbi:hypothetical protein Cabys_2418 [Caldithrix abyssi DSM 13497]|uniref:Uncharacterized protein n=1 Tax=Caldithrix abyssi DSM 13497 TaxID=880073 RepID=A0A1J1C940_CALAY|nr:hypothetical protein Cabys_2418 [Caldithrix abyssi DSM 13497]